MAEHTIDPSPTGTGTGTTNGLTDHHIAFIPLSYDHERLESSARELVLALLPEWANGGVLELERFTDGITNTLLKAAHRKDGMSKQEADRDAVLLRAYGHGTDVLIDRHREAQNHEQLMKYSLAPKLLAQFENGMIYRYLAGTPSSPSDLRTKPIYLAVARRMAQWHATMPCIYENQSRQNGSCPSPAEPSAPALPSPNVWTVMQKWIHALPTKTQAEQDRQANLQKELTRLMDELSRRPGLGDNGVSHPYP
jgi:ethanolamine kinase